jgi:2'-5' RNA ligase
MLFIRFKLLYPAYFLQIISRLRNWSLERLFDPLKMADLDPKEFLRLFLAISIPEAVREELRRLQRELTPFLPPQSIRWTRPEQFHLTLKFLGNVSVTEVPALRETVHEICAVAPSMHLRAESVGVFPNEFSPRVFWVDIKNPDGQLARLQQQLEDAVGPFAEKPEEKKFTAHVTLARFEKLKQHDAETFAAIARTDKVIGEWTAQEVQLMQSTLQPTGALHAILDTFRTKNSETF